MVFFMISVSPAFAMKKNYFLHSTKICHFFITILKIVAKVDVHPTTRNLFIN